MLVQNRTADERKDLDDALFSRPGEVDPETGLKPPPGWGDETDVAASANTFLKTLRR
jgi:hypothetical protein